MLVTVWLVAVSDVIVVVLKVELLVAEVLLWVRLVTVAHV
jgi:hypothetical protein